jgi:hypothetical protein
LDNKSLEKYGFFEKTTSCVRDCTECHYCDEIADKLIRLKVPTRGKLEDLGMHDIAEQMEKHGKLS